jgi:hypothetical protein
VTRSSNIVVGYFGKRQFDPKDSLAKRLAQRANSKRRPKMIATNVGELIEALKTLNPTARIYTIDPPFDGLRLVEQGDGAILFCRPSEPEKATPASQA